MSLPEILPASTDELTAQAHDFARKVGDQLSDRTNDLRDSVSSARYHSEEFIRANPWPAVGLAAGLGFALGIVIARR